MGETKQQTKLKKPTVKPVGQNQHALVSVARYPLLDGKQFTYLVNSDESIGVGDLVQVPFGKRSSLGVVYAKTNPPKNKLPYALSPITKRLDLPKLPSYLIKLADWLQSYYVASPMAVWQTILPSAITAASRIKPTVGAGDLPGSKLNRLTPSQENVLESIKTSTRQSFLLHGVTGSGKTEIFLHLIADTLQQRRSVLVLVPEIMLTTQIIERVETHFEPVVVLHSGLSPAQRKANWRYILENSHNTPMVVLGTRSSLFSPIHNLGLVIIDEEHEPSYKQESAPRYQAQVVAAKICQDVGCKLVLASATPSVSTYYLASLGRITLLELPNRPKNFATLPTSQLITLQPASDLLSPELQSGITQTLQDKKQVLLFLNLRGSARALLCKSCGATVDCPRCEISLSFHADLARLCCHYCNYQQLPPTRCGVCGNADISFIGSGTKQLETELGQLFPDAKVARIDRDSAKLDHLQKTYRDFRSGKIDILAGTQMISRGLDIPNLQLVGIINANTSLAIPDFSASERTFQLVTQAAGRAGRRKQIGQVLIQTYSPKNTSIAAAAQHDYKSFYASEVAKRQHYLYPPFVYLLKLSCAHKQDKRAEQAAEAMKHKLAEQKDIVVLGPTPAFQKKIAGTYRWQIIVKAKQRARLSDIARALPAGWTADLDPINLL